MTDRSTRNKPFPFGTAAFLIVALAVAACGGGGSPTAQVPVDPDTSQPPMVTDPVTPVTPTVDSAVIVANDAAIDPTLAFRAMQVPATAGFDVTKTVPDSPVTVIGEQEAHANSPTPPRDLDAMLARAAHLWTRRLQDGGSHEIRLVMGHPFGTLCGGAIACAGYGHGDPTGRAAIGLTDRFLTGGTNAQGNLAFAYFRTLVHEVGHTLAYRDPYTGTGHADCPTDTEQVMCGGHGPNRPTAPTEADFAGLYSWTVGPETNYQDFGLWATVPGTSGLDRFGVSLRRTVAVDENNAEYISDTIRLKAEVRGTASAGPAAATGTATWSGVFLGADTGLFEPVTGNVTLTADLADLASINLALLGLKRTDGAGATHLLAPITYELKQQGNAWIDAGSRANARFYANGAEPAAAAAGLVNDANLNLAGAWAGLRN